MKGKKHLQPKKQKKSQATYILIINDNTKEKALLDRLCSRIGSVYVSSSLEEVKSLTKKVDFHVVVADCFLALSFSLKNLFKASTSVIITGDNEKTIRKTISEWPQNRYIESKITPLNKKDFNDFIRILRTAAQHSHIRIEHKNLQNALNQTKLRLKEAHFQIKEFKSFINDSILKEMEKRIELETKYTWVRKEKEKIENILKKLYVANDVTSLLDIVYDIKKIVNAKGISIYILDKSEKLGKHLKPLVWNNSFLTYPDITKHIVSMNSKDFAASAATKMKALNISNVSGDERLSKRYLEQLQSSLKSILSVPIMNEKEIIGVLEVYNKIQKGKSRKKGFTKEDLQLMNKFSEHISIAITKLNLIQYDALTGLLRPDPFFEKVIQKLISQSKRRKEDSLYALVMGDVDWFKNYNDSYGQESGNKLLRELAYVLKSSVREEDLLCRYGGEEFLFFLTTIESKEDAIKFTERIRKNVEEYYFDYQEFQPRKNLTMSFGISCFTARRFSSIESIAEKDIIKICNEANIALREAKGKITFPSELQTVSANSVDKNTIRIYDEALLESEKFSNNAMHSKNIPPQERRASQRFFTSTTLIYKANARNKVAKIINLNLGGAKVCSKEKFPIEQICDLTILLGDNAIQCKGNVLYSEKDTATHLYYSGFKFKDMSWNDRQILTHYFASLPIKSKFNL